MKKLYYLLLVAGIVLPFSSCSNDDDDSGVDVSITPSSITMHYDDTQKLTSTNVDTWSSEDDFIATVKDGIVTGGHVGSTKIIGQGGKKKASCDVTIAPEYNLFDAPILDWGSSISNVKSRESHKLSSSSEKIIIYDYTKSGVPMIMSYTFENSKLKNALIWLPFSKYVTATYHLTERYQPVSYDSDDLSVMYVDAYEKSKIKTAILQKEDNVDGSTITSVFFTSYASIAESPSKAKSQLEKSLEQMSRRVPSQLNRSFFNK